jgi:glycosyltransferase involved in cell wall biosynthesis
VSMFLVNEPDQRIAQRKNTRLIRLGKRKQSVRILSEFLMGAHQILFYMKASPASRLYSSLRQRWRDARITIGTMESQSDVRNEPTISEAGVRLWEQTILRCDYLFSNSAHVQRGLEREYGIKSQVIPTGVDTRFFTPDWQRAKNNRVQILFAGSLRPFKQPQFVLSAAARFPSCDFRIAGDGTLRPELESRMAREGLTNVRLLGALGAEALRQEYRQADIFLFPSRWEGSPKVILEAAACGLPVIVRNNYSPETVVHEVTGYQAGTDAELFGFLQTLIDNPELRDCFGRAGRQHSQRFDWDLITAQWEKTFIELEQRHTMRRAS